MRKASCPKCGQKFGWRGPRLVIVQSGFTLRSQNYYACPSCSVRLSIQSTLSETILSCFIYALGICNIAMLGWSQFIPDRRFDMEVIIVIFISWSVLSFWELNWTRRYIVQSEKP